MAFVPPLDVTMMVLAPIAAVTEPKVSVAAALTRPLKLIPPDRRVIGAVSLMRLLFWV